MYAKAQRLAGQGVVAVEEDFVALDFDYGKGPRLAIGIAALELPADFDAGRKLGFGDGLQQRLVALATSRPRCRACCTHHSICRTLLILR